MGFAPSTPIVYNEIDYPQYFPIGVHCRGLSSAAEWLTATHRRRPWMAASLASRRGSAVAFTGTKPWSSFTRASLRVAKPTTPRSSHALRYS
jgi:hypothetical protein